MDTATKTTGPWSVSTALLTNDGGRPVMGVDDEGCVVRVALVDCQSEYKRGQGWCAPCAIREANAALISAAPDLLAALKALLDLHAANVAIYEHQVAIAAIAKAEGRS